MAAETMTKCEECSMFCIPSEYHPYAACLMFRGCNDAETVRANLAALRSQAEPEKIRMEITREEVIRIKNTGCGNEWPKVWNRQLNNLCDAYLALSDIYAAPPEARPEGQGAVAKLWLWRNFVDGKPEYWAFDNAYPCHPNGDPITLGEPCGYAIFKESTQGRTDVSEEQVLAAPADGFTTPCVQVQITEIGKPEGADIRNDMAAILQTACDADEADPKDLLRQIAGMASKHPWPHPTPMGGQHVVVSDAPPAGQPQPCWCQTCRPITMNNMRMVLCPDCGYKRCPKANDHRNACTNSNESGQVGSAYPVPTAQNEASVTVDKSLWDRMWNFAKQHNFDFRDGPMLTSATVDDIDRYIGGQNAAKDEGRETWTCFHCGEVFTDRRSAQEHFGRDESADAACVIKAGAERSMLTALRRTEDAANEAWGKLHSESSDFAKAYAAQTARHSVALQTAEELGYQRGLCAHLAAQPPSKARRGEGGIMSKKLQRRMRITINTDQAGINAVLEFVPGERPYVYFSVKGISGERNLTGFIEDADADKLRRMAESLP